MKSKKVLGLLLAFTLGFSLLPGKAFAQTTNNIKAANVVADYAPAHIDSVMEMLKNSGAIPEGASYEEALKITMEYIGRGSQREVRKKSEIEFNKIKKIKEALVKSGVKPQGKRDIDNSLSPELPNEVQAETYEGEAFVARPLVILIDFPDYTKDDFIEAEDLEFKFDDYSKEHYQEMLFNDDTFKGPNGEDLITFKKYYTEQSGGSYIADGGVYGWYRAKHDAAYYGAPHEYGHDINARELVQEALQHVANDPNVDLSQYDIEDRFDLDDDGNVREPDGILDHVIIIHASVGEEQGGGSLGADAIWSHKTGFYPFYDVTDTQGRTFSTYQYNVDPQSGAVGVFAHEYGHDLGLPDEYNTTNEGRGEPVESWSIMSGGSWNGKISGTEPVGFSPWAKEFLQAGGEGNNWSKGTTIDIDELPAEGLSFLLDEASTKGVNNDVIRINLPDYSIDTLGIEYGEKCLYGGKDNNLDNNAKFAVDLTGKTNSVLKFKTLYDIEEQWDFGNIYAREIGSEEWTLLPGNITVDNVNGDAVTDAPFGITGIVEEWVDAEFPLGDFDGKEIEISIRYQTDAYVTELGWRIDELQVVANGETIFEENFEDDINMELDGFEVTDGMETNSHYYLAEWRNHSGVDLGLKQVRSSFAYEPGMVLWYVNNDRYDELNHVDKHPGYGFLGIVDADQQPSFYIRPDGSIRNYALTQFRLNDAAFGLNETTPLQYYYPDGMRYEDLETFMNPYFSDAKDYSNGEGLDRQGGLVLPKYGLKIYVTGQSKDMSVGRIHIIRDNK